MMAGYIGTTPKDGAAMTYDRLDELPRRLATMVRPLLRGRHRKVEPSEVQRKSTRVAWTGKTATPYFTCDSIRKRGSKK